jgi:hypothetical protein
MFGITAFSQAPFSSLGQNVFSVTVAEQVNCSVAETCIGTFLASQAETIQFLDAPDDERITFAANNESASFDSTVSVRLMRMRSLMQ